MTLIISEHVKQAMHSGYPVVALETAVLTAGLPKTSWRTRYGHCPSYIDESLPINIALAQAMNTRIASKNAMPVWIGVLDGVLHIGLSPDQLNKLARDEDAGKVSYANIANTINEGKSAGTTVATTLLACKLASPKNPIRVFATGGIGGVHKNWTINFDVSADLLALASTPTCVVASGAKSILDLHATVESLETLGVPTLGYKCDRFPPFIEQSSNKDPHITKTNSSEEIAKMCNTHWKSLSLSSAVLAAVPAPETTALKRGSMQSELAIAEKSWAEQGLPSATRTPFLLDALATATKGNSLIANLELLCNNASVAAELSVCYAQLN